MFNFEQIVPDIPWLLSGIPLTLLITLAAFTLGFAIAMPLALVSLGAPPTPRRVVIAWIEFFLITPPLVHIIWAFYVLPYFGILINDVVIVIIALAAGVSAQMAEVLRAGIQSVPKGQYEAAVVLGLSPFYRLIDVIMPQTLRFALAPSCNTFAGLMKDSSLAAIIAVPELMNRGEILSVQNFRPLEVLTFVAFLYFALIYPFILLGFALEQRSRRGYQTA